MHHGTGSWRDIGPGKHFTSKAAMLAHYVKTCPSKMSVGWNYAEASCIAESRKFWGRFERACANGSLG